MWENGLGDEQAPESGGYRAGVRDYARVQNEQSRSLRTGSADDVVACSAAVLMLRPSVCVGRYRRSLPAPKP